jgi:Uri superfamily endonuclease
MDLPSAKGTYVLLIHVHQLKRLPVGRLGTFDLRPGFYAYVGSAFGPGGLRARLTHHIEVASDPHWHIDHLLRLATPIEAWFAPSDRKLEHDWVELFEQEKRFTCPIPRFGSSDYRRSRSSHLFFSRRRPSFVWFEQRVRDLFRPQIRPQRAVLAPMTAPEPPSLDPP